MYSIPLGTNLQYNADMCGRYRFWDKQNPDIAKLIEAAKDSLPEMTFKELSLAEVFPGSLVLVRTWTGKDGFTVCRWGFPMKGKTLINARSETWETTAFYHGSWPCIVPASAYYEWNVQHEKYSFAGAGTIFMAGLLKKFGEEWHMVILTEAAQGKNADIHHRQPVLLRQEDFPAWLQEKQLVPDRREMYIVKE